MLDSKKLQAIRDKILGVTENRSAYGDLNSVVYLQQILDAVKGADLLNVRGNLAEHVYLQKIRNAKLGVADGQFGNLPNSLYLQQIINAFNGVADGAFGNFSDGELLDRWYSVASGADPNRINLSTGLSRWRAALASGYATMLITGDSIGIGQGAAVPATQGWHALLKAQLESLYGGAAGGYVCNLDATELARWTLGAGWANYSVSSTSAWGHRGMLGYSAGGGTAAITLTGIGLDFYAVRGAATIAHSVAIDGGAPFSMGAVSGPTILEKHAVPGLASAAHSIVITPGAGAAYSAGVMVKTAAAGLNFTNNSFAGATAAVHATNALKLSHRALVGFDLTIIPIGVNDYLGQTPLAAFTTTIRGTLAATNAKDILLIATNNSGTVKAIPQSSYAAIMKQAAIDYGCAFIDIGAIWGSYAVANAAGWMNDVTHPNTAGHQQYYNELARWLLG